MNPFNPSNVVEQILQRFSGPVRKVRTLLFVRENGTDRVVQEQEDRTEIGPGGAIETTVTHVAHFLDCGHFAADNVGGRCACGAVVCGECLAHCARCGAPLCRTHQRRNDATGEILCPACHRKARSKRRIQAVTGAVTSLFVRKGGADESR